MINRPPRSAFNTPALIGRYGKTRPLWYYPLLALGVLTIGSLILGLASAIRGASSRPD